MNLEQFYFSDRILKSSRSFIREILKATSHPGMISFAGGHPDPSLFPVEELRLSTESAFRKYGSDLLQYGISEGFIPLREKIFERYYKNINYSLSSENILITTGSQQALDLIGKVLINPGDPIFIERPGYLGAIQAFSMYEPSLVGIPLEEDGMDLEFLKRSFGATVPKFLYSNPTFQNPTGKTLPLEKRKRLAEILKSQNSILVEDNPYGEIRFDSENLPSVQSFYPEGTISLGTFSKTLTPGFRVGWICAPKEMIDKILIAKQASDLHSNLLSQIVLDEYLNLYDLDLQIEKTRSSYRIKKERMEESLLRSMSGFAEWVSPQGGMFFWLKLKDIISSMELFESAIANNVAFVPGFPFYTNDPETDTMRINFSHSSLEAIETGILRISESIRKISKIQV
ncbi:PLP-dependent aminotransferase family protein [Leptospira yasudae]|uniref:aminotransferase-like domain-containing protein n=1 Tax=Leptospira yasudae TaxID=2202201 RepID=UPI0010848734|nr:PLP-dependent aminotransferase family protein [Leptospira yasudae]TGK30461.1 PLP-dependent aminotransferase family protein [Leptospira yasudae]TGM04160.1 PLP-dependent aminotransferase family protein [Leptospira yasudae]